MANFARWALADVGPPTYLRIHFRAAARRSLLRLCHEGSETMASNRKDARGTCDHSGKRDIPITAGDSRAFPQVGVKIKNIWNHHPVMFTLSSQM